MFKKFVAASAAVLMMAGVASAATREINLYGASAQYLFWNDAADDFMTDKGCSGIVQAQDADKKNGITLGYACSAYGDDDLIIRYSAKASFDGIMAMKNTEHPDAPTTCTNKSERPMADVVSGTTVTSLACKDVTLGASDVAAEAFVQQSIGSELGPNGGDFVFRDFVSNPVDGSGLNTYNPVVVPFAPFLSKNVTMSTCDGGVDDGEMCQTLSDCGDGATGCTAKPVANISREMMVNIFSGQATMWSDFGAGFPAQPITVCLRHAGSGTHATIDHAVMNNKWGGQLMVFENAAAPIAWFNDGSSDMMKCVTANKTTDINNTDVYAIGYADADQLEAKPEYAPYAYRPKYNGYNPTRVNIRNGLYDWFSAQWLYEDPNEPNYSLTHQVVLDLNAFAANPAKIPSTKAKYWASQDEMVFFKNSDYLYPGFRGATNHVNP